MTRIFTWVAATLVVVALITYYQANLSGEGEHAHGAETAACGAPQTTADQTAAGDTPAREAAEGDAAAGEDKSGDPCASSDHGGKPGESK